MINNDGFLEIPGALKVRSISEITSMNKIILSRVSFLAKTRGYCSATDETLAKELGTHRPKVSAAIKKGIELGIFKIDKKYQGKKVVWRKIWINTEVLQSEYVDIRIDYRILNNPYFDWTKKILLGEIISLSARVGYCFATNADIAKSIGLSERQTRSLINELEQGGYLIINLRNNNDRSVYVDLEKLFRVSPICPSVTEEGGGISTNRVAKSVQEGGGIGTNRVAESVTDRKTLIERHNRKTENRNSPFLGKAPHLQLLIYKMLAYHIAAFNLNIYENQELEMNLANILKAGYSKDDIIKYIKVVSKANRENECGEFSELDPKSANTYELEVFESLFVDFLAEGNEDEAVKNENFDFEDSLPF